MRDSLPLHSRRVESHRHARKRCTNSLWKKKMRERAKKSVKELKHDSVINEHVRPKRGFARAKTNNRTKLTVGSHSRGIGNRLLLSLRLHGGENAPLPRIGGFGCLENQSGDKARHLGKHFRFQGFLLRFGTGKGGLQDGGI